MECGLIDYINGDPVITKKKAKDIIRKHMNDGWIPVERELPPNAKHKGAFCPKVRVMTKFGEHTDGTTLIVKAGIFLLGL